MSKVEQVDIDCWKAIFGFTDETVDPTGDDMRGIELLATHRAGGRAEGYAQCQGEVIKIGDAAHEAAVTADCYAVEADRSGQHAAPHLRNAAKALFAVSRDLATAIEQSAQGDGG